MLLLAVQAIVTMSNYMTMTVIVLYMTDLECTASLAGFVAGAAPIASMLARPVIGFAIDRYNLKHILALGLSCMVLSFLLQGLLQVIAAILVARIIQGFGFALITTALISFVVLTVPKTRTGEAIGYIGIANVLGLSIGPSLAMALLSFFGIVLVYVSSATVLALSLLALSGVASPKTKQPPAVAKNISLDDFFDTRLVPLLLITIAFNLMSGFISSFLTTFGHCYDIENISVYFVVNAACLLFLRPLAGRLVDRRSLSYAIYPAFAAASCAMISFAFAQTLIQVLPIAVLMALAQGLSIPALQTECLRWCNAAKTGVGASMFFIGADLGQSAGPILGGALIPSLGFRGVFLAFVAICLAAAIYYRVTIHHKSRKTKGGEYDTDKD